jgi:Mg-chelatase subunit ChlD
LLKIVADARSEDRDARLRGYDAAVERGLLVVARIVLWADGLVPERDADARAPRLRAAALPADPAAEGEKDRRRTAFAQLIQARPKLIRERAVSRLFVAPFRVASVESEDFLTAAEYATYAVGLASAEILSILEPIENGADPADGTNEKAPAVRAVKQARATAYKVLKGQAKAAAAKIRNALKPGAEPFGKPASRPAGPPRPAGEEEIDPRTGKPRPSTTFYGIQTRSKRILYILDVSGSMSDPRARSGDKLPIDVAKEELTQSIRSLPEDAVFNIVFFNHEVAAWKEKPVKADKAGKTEASAWIAARAPAGATNIFDALERGFRLAGRGTHDKQYAVAVDTIFFLSDGQANRGRLVEPAQIVAEVRRLNSEQKLKIHAVGIGKGHDPALMRALAEISGGTYVSK